MAPTLARVDFGNPALVDAKIGRNVMLDIPQAEAIPNLADNFVSQFGAIAPVLACHEIISVHGAI